MMKTDRLLGMLGLAARARHLSIGSSLSCDAVARGAYLAITASDASENTEKRMRDRCDFYECKYLRLEYTSSELGHAIGKSGAVAAVAVNDPNFAAAIERLILGDDAKQNESKDN